MQSRRDLERHYGNQPFRSAEAIAAGYGSGLLRGEGVPWVHRGARRIGPTPTTLLDRALHYVPLLRSGDRFSHATALAILGCPIRAARGAPVDVESRPAVGQVRRKGVCGHRSKRGVDPFISLVPGIDQAVPTVRPLDAVLQAASTLPFSELVVALDHLLSPNVERWDPETRIEVSGLAEFVGSRASGRGVRRFRQAASLARVGGDSRMETLLRLAGVRAGVSGLRLQADIYDDEGRWIGRFDLVDEMTRTIFEFDGEHHRTNRKQYLRDIGRRERARACGWRVIRFHREDVLDRPARTGERMLALTGRPPTPIPEGLKRMLDERSTDEETESVGGLERPGNVR